MQTNQTESLLQQAWEQKWPAPAKINRFLHIVGQRDDGYHLIQSVFQIIDFCDYLQFSPNNTNSISLKTSMPSIDEKDNLIFKAAFLLQQHCKINSGVSISIEKNLPMGAGLGGGSSNAATTLLALNLLWNCQLTINELSDLGLQLGADVPFFIQGKNAFVEGVGEKITPLPIHCPWLALAIENVHISTKDIFSSPDLRRDTPHLSIEDLNQFFNSEQQQLLLFDFGKNDCEEVVIKNYYELNQLLQQMKEYSNPRMTGTGSCIFSVFPSETEAQQALSANANKNKLLIKKTLPESPILELLEKYNKNSQ